MQTGISLYLSRGRKANRQTIEKAASAGVHHAFTSLHIPEEQCSDYRTEALSLLRMCREADISLVCDVSPLALKKLGVDSFDQLLDLGVDHMRLDFGFDAAQTVELSRRFHIVFNASTISRHDLAAWRAAGADFSRFSACHNFYPKRYTALSLDEVRRVNERLSLLGFETMAFIPGDGELRGPLCEGLPTVEAHRGHTGSQLAVDMLELYNAQTDIVLVGDPDVSDGVWERVRQVSEGAVSIRAQLDEKYSYLLGRVQHNRPDPSDWVFRAQESRLWAHDKDQWVDAMVPAPVAAPSSCELGTILVSNTDYGRYAGEVEIALRPLELDGCQNVAGRVDPRDMALLAQLRHGMGLRLVAA